MRLGGNQGCVDILRDIFVAPPNHFLSSFPSFHPDVRKRLHTPTTTIFLEVTWSEREYGFYIVSSMSRHYQQGVPSCGRQPYVLTKTYTHTQTDTHTQRTQAHWEKLEKRCWKGGYMSHSMQIYLHWLGWAGVGDRVSQHVSKYYLPETTATRTKTVWIQMSAPPGN